MRRRPARSRSGASVTRPWPRAAPVGCPVSRARPVVGLLGDAGQQARRLGRAQRERRRPARSRSGASVTRPRPRAAPVGCPVSRARPVVGLLGDAGQQARRPGRAERERRRPARSRSGASVTPPDRDPSTGLRTRHRGAAHTTVRAPRPRRELPPILPPSLPPSLPSARPTPEWDIFVADGHGRPTGGRARRPSRESSAAGRWSLRRRGGSGRGSGAARQIRSRRRGLRVRRAPGRRDAPLPGGPVRRARRPGGRAPRNRAAVAAPRNGG